VAGRDPSLHLKNGSLGMTHHKEQAGLNQLSKMIFVSMSAVNGNKKARIASGP
jgi:hypothetical protein